MEISKILNADVLDIIFDGKNKAYGAYDLRKNYNKRLATALSGMGAILLVFFVGSVLATGKNNDTVLKVGQQVDLVDISKIKKEIEPIPLPKVVELPKIKTVDYSKLKIVPDKDVSEDTKPPVVDELLDSKIGTINQDGVKEDGIIAPPVEAKGFGNAIAPKLEAEEDYDKVFIKVEKPATFFGGFEGWKRYLETHLQYPDAAEENGTQGIVRVQMVVDASGNVTEVKTLNDPGNGLAAEAERVIKRGPKWEPAEQNGRKVTYRFIQTITFQIH